MCISMCINIRIRIVYASRYPPTPAHCQRPLAYSTASPEDGRLGRLLGRALGGGLGPRKPLLESSWRRLGGSLSRLGSSWRALGASWARWGRSWRRLGSPGAVLEACKRHLGGSLGRLGAVLGAMLEPSRGQKAPKIEPKRVPNRAPEATRAEYGETLFFNDSTQDFNGFSSLRPPFLS